MKKRKKWRGIEIFSLLFSALLLFYSVLNLPLLSGQITDLSEKGVGFEGFTAGVERAYTTQPAWKNEFVNLYGLFARLTGQRLCNNTVRLNDGILAEVNTEPQATGQVAYNLTNFNSYLSGQDIPFLYVMAPYKVDLDRQLQPYGTVNFFNGDADSFLAALEQSHVNTLDLRPALSQNAEMVEQNFFRTDHHWNFAGALRACPLILEQMDALLPEQTLDTAYAAFDQWEGHTLEKWYLGSHGKRTGIYFGGVDDMTYYTPKFDTQLSRVVIHNEWFFRGDFVQANMDTKYFEEKDYFNDSPYCMYVGGDYPLVQHRNSDAPNQLKVLMIKDSFTLPLQCYFSTLFSEVDVLDPRYLGDFVESVAEYVSVSKPDIVVMMTNPVGGISNEAYADFGTVQEQRREHEMTGEQEVLFQGDVEVAASSTDYSYTVIDAKLEPGQRYTLRFDAVSFPDSPSEPEGVFVRLYDMASDTPRSLQIFDVDFGNRNGAFTWCFDTPEDGSKQMKLLLYAGEAGKTAGIHAIYSNVSVTHEK